MDKLVLHVYMLKECTHKCPHCCNNLYDIDKLPVLSGGLIDKADTICLTGGEPFLLSDIGVTAAVLHHEHKNIKNVYAYTSGGKVLCNYILQNKGNMGGLDGITIAPKSDYDWHMTAEAFHLYTPDRGLASLKSVRLIVFKEQVKHYEHYVDAFEGTNAQILCRFWDDKFNTPDNEVFCKFPFMFKPTTKDMTVDFIHKYMGNTTL
jgi:hypothetical protein